MNPMITIAVPSLNQGCFLDAALYSIFQQDISVEVVVLDGGSTDGSLSVIKKWESRLFLWKSGPDNGQAAAINEGIGMGTAPYVCWLNADDILYSGGLELLLNTLEENPRSPFAYGRCWTISSGSRKLWPYLTCPFFSRLFDSYCFIAQPATLIRREAWEHAGGLDEDLHFAMDYDLWWRLYHLWGVKPEYNGAFIAGTRLHSGAKTQSHGEAHYVEAMAVVKRHTGYIPLKWHLIRPIRKLWGA